MNTRRIILRSFILVVYFLAYTLSATANDTIRFTWQGSTNSKSVWINATYGKVFIVNWNDGYTDTLTGIGNFQTLSHTYADTNLYNVVIAGSTADCFFTNLSCGFSALTKLYANAALETLWCPSNQLTVLDVSGCPFLKTLECYSNRLTSLSLNKNAIFELIRCDDNQITSLDLQPYTELQTLYCYGNRLANLDLQTNTKLKYLYCNDNLLTNMDVSKNTMLFELTCNDNLLKILDIHANTNLNYLDCSNNLLADLDLTTGTTLSHFYCSGNKLKELNLHANTNLSTLNCSNNLLTDLDLSANTALQDLDCSVNLLTDLNLQANKHLRNLNCVGNGLTDLNVEANTALLHLYCSSNFLTDLNLQTNTALGWLDCSKNQLTNLSIADIHFVSISCYDNHLQLSDLYNASEKVSNLYGKNLGTQHLGTQVIMLNDSTKIDYSTQTEFGDTATVFTILNKSGNSAPSVDYTLYDGVIMFNYADKYKIIMTNSAITSHPSHPAEVVAEFWVANASSILSDLSVSEGILTPDFNSLIINYSVDVGYNISSIIITATPNDPQAIIIGDTGLQELQLGANVFTITVRDRDYISTLEYTLTVNRANVGINNYKLPITNYVVYPNPTTGKLRIDNAQLSIKNIELFDIVGKKQLSIFNCPLSIEIDISHLANGMYFIKIDNKMYKIIKE
jgi:Leucine-rich repeat (LRR) protein